MSEDQHNAEHFDRQPAERAAGAGDVTVMQMLADPITLSGPKVVVESLEEPKTLIALGRFKLAQELVRGPVHSVFRGQELQSGVEVAIKILRGAQPGSSAPERLCREWQIISALKHPHIVKVIDFGAQASALCLVLEYLDGPSLDRFVKHSGALPFAMAAQFICQAASALAHAHQHGIIHRDVKPSNFVLSDDGRIKLIDFGIAHNDDELYSLTIVHGDNLVGTADYMSPEQALAPHLADERADIYSLGCTLFFLLTGQAPYAGGTLAARLLKHRDEPIPALTSYRANVPPELVALFEQMVAKQPADRIQTMAEVQAVLAAWLEASAKADATTAAKLLKEVPFESIANGDTLLAPAVTQSGVFRDVAPAGTDAANAAEAVVVSTGSSVSFAGQMVELNSVGNAESPELDVTGPTVVHEEVDAPGKLQDSQPDGATTPLPKRILGEAPQQNGPDRDRSALPRPGPEPTDAGG